MFALSQFIYWAKGVIRNNGWGTNMCPWLKTHYMAFYLVKLFCKRVDTLLSNKKNHFEWAYKAKLDFLPMDQIFCPGKFQICPGQKKRFVLAYGRGIKMFITFILSNLTKLNSSFGKVFLDWFLTDCPQLFLWLISLFISYSTTLTHFIRTNNKVRKAAI